MEKPKRFITFKISKINLPFIDVLNMGTEAWRSEVREIIPFSEDCFIIGVMITGEYPFMEDNLRENADKLLNTKQGEQIMMDEWRLFDNGEWLTQSEYYDKYPDPVIEKFRCPPGTA